ncbi:hypothetical protein Ppa06_42840 [Planomonospora parontospora subsp. parontospora]|uniref:Uncharacterized protein n=2 Tax=Planomonospora parontospora TaxID=58119 RepID=A0AA37BK85_9ACTN|nr:hypothetical protein [Planomonospora parontospora]GGK83656.1 hypothetical protein GCM10010126_48690 [Planomonospora parontospora]GII10486.1 hypothetical protein Ppa06_42840 [Planomonospora parontospora subsp. parontospora]
MPFDLERYAFLALFFALFAGLPAVGAIRAAELSAPPDHHEPMSRRLVVVGLLVSLTGVLSMGTGAWLAREDSRYGAIEAFGMLLITFIGAGLLVAGLGSLPSWLLELSDRYTKRLPLPFRLAVRDLVRRRGRTVIAITLAMMATAFAVALTVIAVGETTQSRAQYSPRARPGSLLVRPSALFTQSFSAADAGTVRAAIEREFPGVPIAQSERPSDEFRHLSARAENVEMPEEAVYWYQAIGDEKLLRYLTGDQSAPYDEDTAVVITSTDVKVDSVELSYMIHQNDTATTTKTVRAGIARTADPRMETIFIPSKIVQDLGYRLQPAELIIDPALHRVTVQEQERLDDRLDDAVAETYVERGFEASTWWLPVVAAALLTALACALTTGFGSAANARPARLLRRPGNGPGVAFRWFCAFRAGLAALCATVLGAVAGCPAGMLLLWPLTVPTTWDEPARVPFETPWPAIVAVVAVLPLLAAAIGALLAREQAHTAER